MRFSQEGFQLFKCLAATEHILAQKWRFKYSIKWRQRIAMVYGRNMEEDGNLIVEAHFPINLEEIAFARFPIGAFHTKADFVNLFCITNYV